MSAPGLVLVLDGPSSVGKSATLAVLQQRWPEVRPGPLVEVGIGHTLDALGPSFGRWRTLIEHVEHHGDDPPERVTWGALGRELVAGMHRAAAAWSRAGFDVAVDHVLLDRSTASDLAEALDGLPVLHVGLTCDEEELARREADRDDPTLAHAVAQLAASRDAAVRDVVIDTTDRAVTDVAELVLRHVQRHVTAR